MTLEVSILTLMAVTLGLILAVPVGRHLASVWSREATVVDRVAEPLERVLCSVFRVDPRLEQGAVRYTASLISYNAVGFLFLYSALRALAHWRGETQAATAIDPDVAFRIAIGSLAGLAPYAGGPAAFGLSSFVIIFFAGGSGLAVAAVLCRTFASRGRAGVGNFWSDLIRASCYVLLPLTIIGLGADALSRATGHFGVREVQSLVITAGLNSVNFACCVAFGRVTRSRANGGALVVVTALMAAAAFMWPKLSAIDHVIPDTPRALANALFTAIGQVGFGPLFAGPLAFALLAVSICGLLIGRTPEYVGKRLHAREIKLLTLASLALWATVLALATLAILLVDIRRQDGSRLMTNDETISAYGNGCLAVIIGVARFGLIVPMLAIAARMAGKPRRAPTAGTSILAESDLIALVLVGATAVTAAPVARTAPLYHHRPAAQICGHGQT